MTASVFSLGNMRGKRRDTIFELTDLLPCKKKSIMIATFLIGAGASCGTVRMVTQLPEKMSHIVKYLKNSKEPLTASTRLPLGKDLEFFRVQLIVDIEWLSKESANHASIDKIYYQVPAEARIL